MPFVHARVGRRRDPSDVVVEHYSRTIHRVLDFLGYTIHDVVNDPARREHVRRACKLSFRIRRDLRAEPWRTEATRRLAERIDRRLAQRPGSTVSLQRRMPPTSSAAAPRQAPCLARGNHENI